MTACLNSSCRNSKARSGDGSGSSNLPDARLASNGYYATGASRASSPPGSYPTSSSTVPHIANQSRHHDLPLLALHQRTVLRQAIFSLSHDNPRHIAALDIKIQLKRPGGAPDHPALPILKQITPLLRHQGQWIARLQRSQRGMDRGVSQLSAGEAKIDIAHCQALVSLAQGGIGATVKHPAHHCCRQLAGKGVALTELA